MFAQQCSVSICLFSTALLWEWVINAITRNLAIDISVPAPNLSSLAQVKVVSEPERIDVFLTRSCAQLTVISCGVVYEATSASLVLFRSYRYVFRDANVNGHEFVISSNSHGMPQITEPWCVGGRAVERHRLPCCPHTKVWWFVAHHGIFGVQYLVQFDAYDDRCRLLNVMFLGDKNIPRVFL